MFKSEFYKNLQRNNLSIFFQKYADVSSFVEIQGQLSRKNAWLPQFFFVDSNSPFKDLRFLRGPTLAQKPLYLVGTVLNIHKTS